MDDPQSVYYLHPSDHPGLILVSQPLQGDNYASWRRAMRLALDGKNKLAFVDGTIPVPPVLDPNFRAWERNNSVVASWLLNSISKEITASVIYSTTAMEIWQDLQECYQQHNGPRVIRQYCE